MLKRKRISSILLALVMLFSVMVALPKQASAATDYSDVKEDDTFAPHIAYVTEKNAFQGEDGKFMPGASITRGQVAAVLARAKGLTSAVASDFSDVSADHIFTKDIAAVAKAGIFEGYKDGTFKPEALITRGQAAKVIANAFDYKEVAGKALEFEDVKEGYIFKTYIDALTSNGVLEGDNGKFSPEANVNRGQFAKYLAAPLGYVEPVDEFKVLSVSAINATQVEVAFNAKVDETTAETFGNYTVKELDGQALTSATAAELKEDEKTVVVTFDNTLAKRYQFKVANVQLATDSSVIVAYDDIVTFKADTTAPTVSAERVSTNKFKLKFTEPVTGGTITAKYADGTAINPVNLGLTTMTAGATELDVNLANTVIDNKNIVITLNGVADMAGNLISPQPSMVNVVRLPDDGIEPEIAAVTQTGAKTFTIKFNKDLDGTLAFGNVTVGSTSAIAIDEISASEYEFEMAANLNGLQTVTVAASAAVDLAGQHNTLALTKLVTFTEDTVAPTATSQLVVVSGQEYIQLTFDKDVELVGSDQVTVTGTKVKDYVTTAVSASNVVVEYKNASNKKIVLVPLTDAGLVIEGAVYDVTIANQVANTNGIVSEADVAMNSVDANFTRGEDAASVNTDVVTGVAIAQGATPDDVVVTFTYPSGRQLDGATATNIANYVIAGATVESVTLKAPAATTQVANLKLVENSNTFTGVRNITVKNVKVAGSTKVMDPETINNVILAENVVPTITKAQLTSNTTIVLTFSEDVKGNGGLEVFVGDTKLTDKGTLGTGKHTETDVSSTAANKITITLDSSDAIDAAALAKGVKVKALSTTALTDVTTGSVHNKLVPVTVNVVQ